MSSRLQLMKARKYGKNRTSEFCDVYPDMFSVGLNYMKFHETEEVRKLFRVTYGIVRKIIVSEIFKVSSKNKHEALRQRFVKAIYYNKIPEFFVYKLLNVDKSVMKEFFVDTSIINALFDYDTRTKSRVKKKLHSLVSETLNEKSIKEKMPWLYRSAKRAFGSWENAVEEAGVKDVYLLESILTSIPKENIS